MFSIKPLHFELSPQGNLDTSASTTYKRPSYIQQLLNPDNNHGQAQA